jgi:hypothetical protein
MGSEPRKRTLFEKIGTAFGILSGAVTILSFFLSQGEPLFEGLGNFFTTLSESITQFSISSPAVIWGSALVIWILIFMLRYLAEVEFDIFPFDPDPIEFFVQVIVLLPIALLWIWIFVGVITVIDLVAFLGIYFISMFLSIFFASEFS